MGRDSAHSTPLRAGFVPPTPLAGLGPRRLSQSPLPKRPQFLLRDPRYSCNHSFVSRLSPRHPAGVPEVHLALPKLLDSAVEIRLPNPPIRNSKLESGPTGDGLAAARKQEARKKTCRGAPRDGIAEARFTGVEAFSNSAFLPSALGVLLSTLAFHR